MKSLAVKPKAFFPDFGSVSPSDPEHFLYGEKKEFEFRFLPATVKAGDLLILAVDNDFNFYDPDPSNLTHCAPVMCLGRHEVTAEEAAEQKVEILLETQTADFRDKTNGCARPLAAKMGLYKWSDESYSLLAIGSAYCHPVLATYDIPLSPIIDDSYYTKDEIDEKVDAKLDKPSVEGQPGQILSLDENGQNVWKDEQEIPEQEQADWTEDDTTSPAFIKNKPDLSVYAEKSELAPVATSGDYDDLSNKPAIPTKVSDLTNDSDFQTGSQVQAALLPYSLVTETGARLSMTVDSNYDLVVSLLDKNGNVLSTQDVDLPIESMVVSASYADGTLTLTLQNGQTLDVDISDIVSGLVPETRTVNGHALSQDVTVTASDLGLATVATTGSYNDLSDKPSQDELVPAATSSDAGRVLTVDSNGAPGWETPQAGGGGLPDYLNFQAGGAFTVKLAKVGSPDPVSLEYSLDRQTWTAFSPDETLSFSQTGTPVYIRGDNASFSKDTSNYYKFVFSGSQPYIYGNVMSLIDKSCASRTVPHYCFPYLFSVSGNNAKIQSFQAILPATALGQYCYSHMFDGQTASSTFFGHRVVLPATQLEDNCYSYMFNGCFSLKSVVLHYSNNPPTRRVVDGMFSGCSNLQTLICPNLNGAYLSSWYTSNWMNNAGSSASSPRCFYCLQAETIATRDGNTVPSNWTVYSLSASPDALVPSSTSSDAGKVLTVGETGTPAWEESQGGGADQDTLDALDDTITMLTSIVGELSDKNYFHVTALEPSSVSFRGYDYYDGDSNTFEYSYDRREWFKASLPLAVFLDTGEVLWLRNAGEPNGWDFVNDSILSGNGGVTVGGELLSLASKSVDRTKVFSKGGRRLHSLFKEWTALKGIEPGLNLSINGFNGTFGGAFQDTGLTGIPDNFAFPEGVTNASSLFGGSSSLTNVGAGFVIPSTVTNVTQMFSDCSALASIGDGFTVPSSVTSMGSMLYCRNLTTIGNNVSINPGTDSEGNLNKDRITSIGTGFDYMSSYTTSASSGQAVFPNATIGNGWKIYQYSDL